MSEGAIRDALWSAAHAERAALADDLAGLDDAQWAQPSLRLVGDRRFLRDRYRPAR